ncbi:MAG TPA: cytochrome c peroxidase, partial [Desulfurivibrionaceae bacterium]|nr:cytochrome c peroxidase [Desulfurivibrionaceae bacterium]
LNGGRNAPTSSYAAFIPVFSWDAVEGLYVGGQFWDGRADTLKDQAKGPFLNPVEMAMADEAAVIAAIAAPANPNYKKYLKLFQSAYGVDLQTIDFSDSTLITTLYDRMAEAIGLFEQTTRFISFSSKYDYVLAGLTTLTPQEEAGLALFEGAAGCALCHPSQALVNADGTIVPPLFTDHTYDKLGVPKSTNPLISANPVDYGLGGRLGLPGENGKFRVSTLRNIAMTPPYAHNGYFATLAGIVNFYNTRDVGLWPPPEVPENVNSDELGDLGLTPQQEADLVAFLLTLTDGFAAAMPANFVLPPVTPLN